MQYNWLNSPTVYKWSVEFIRFILLDDVTYFLLVEIYKSLTFIEFGEVFTNLNSLFMFVLVLVNFIYLDQIDT